MSDDTTYGVAIIPKIDVGAAFGVTSKIHPREEEYAYVTPNDLHDVAAFGMLEYLLSQTGGFFFAGALWQAVAILSSQTKFEITPWLFACALSMVFGVVLLIGGYIMFRMKQQKIKKYFPKNQ